MIVRNEAHNLPLCLSSAAGAVDEVVVVDTGSEDGTAALAEQAGARVLSFPWAEDFAAARNAGLALATGDWVLVLDADERLVPGAAAQLRAAVSRGDFDLGMLPLHQATETWWSPEEVARRPECRSETSWLPRLMRRTADLAYEGVVHESVSGWVLRGQRRVAPVEAAIAHYGNVAAVRAALGKDLRNRRLLERRAQAEPDNAMVRTYLARELLRAGDRQAALRESRAGWEALVQGEALGRPRPPVVTVATVHAWLLLDAGQLSEARRVLRRALSLAPPHPNLDLLMAGVLERQGAARPALRRDAVTHLQRCLGQDPRALVDTMIPGATTWAARCLLGNIQIQEGDFEGARLSFEVARREKPDHQVALMGLAEALIMGGRPSEGLRMLAPTMGSSGRDGWVLAAAAAARLGQFAQMGELLSAAERQPPGYASPHRELLALQVHSLQRAHRQLRAITGSEVPLAAGEALEHLAVAEARFAEGDLEGAAEGFLAALSIDASTIDAWVELGVVLQKAGLIEAAEEALRTAVGLWPEGLDARLNLAMLFWESGRPAEAVGELRHLARRFPEHEEVLGLLAGVGVQAPLSTLALLPGGRGSAQLSALAAAMQRRGWRVQPVQEAVLAALSPRGRVDPLAGLPALIEATGAHLVLLDPADPRCGRWRAALPDGVPVLLTTDEAASEEERLPAPRIAPPSVARPLISVVLPRQASLEQVEDWLDAIALQELPPALVELLVEAEHDDELPVGGRPCGLRRISDSGAAAQGRAAGRVVLAADPALPPAPNTLLRYLSALG